MSADSVGESAFGSNSSESLFEKVQPISQMR
jgi:hypothetical protein